MCNGRVTFEVDPQVVGVENLEFTDCNPMTQPRHVLVTRGNSLDLKSSTWSDGTCAISRSLIWPS